MEKNKDFIDLSKLCFAFLIILLHVDNNNIIIRNIQQYISRLGVPFFFTISGYFFIEKLILKKIYWALQGKLSKD